MPDEEEGRADSGMEYSRLYWAYTINVLSAWMLDKVHYWDLVKDCLSGNDSRVFRGLIISMLSNRGYYGLDDRDLVDRKYMFDPEATVDGLDTSDYDGMTDIIRGIPTDSLPSLTAGLYKGIHNLCFEDRPKVHRAKATILYNSEQGMNDSQMLMYFMNSAYGATEIKFDAMVDDHGTPVAFLPEGGLTSDLAARLADIAGCDLDPDSDGPPRFTLFEEDRVVPVDRNILDRETEPLFLDVLCMVEMISSVIWKCGVDFEESFRKGSFPIRVGYMSIDVTRWELWYGERLYRLPLCGGTAYPIP